MTMEIFEHWSEHATSTATEEANVSDYNAHTSSTYCSYQTLYPESVEDFFADRHSMMIRNLITKKSSTVSRGYEVW